MISAYKHIEHIEWISAHEVEIEKYKVVNVHLRMGLFLSEVLRYIKTHYKNDEDYKNKLDKFRAIYKAFSGYISPNDFDIISSVLSCLCLFAKDGIYTSQAESIKKSIIRMEKHLRIIEDKKK